MDKFIDEISSTYWWIGVVVVGIVINIASSYIRKIMESRLSNISIYWKGKKKERVEKIAKKVDILRNNSELRGIYALRESRYRIRSIGFTIFGILSGTVGVWASEYKYTSNGSLALAAILFLIGLSDHRDAMKVKNLVESATDGIDELDT